MQATRFRGGAPRASPRAPPRPAPHARHVSQVCVQATQLPGAVASVGFGKGVFRAWLGCAPLDKSPGHSGPPSLICAQKALSSAGRFADRRPCLPSQVRGSWGRCWPVTWGEPQACRAGAEQACSLQTWSMARATCQAHQRPPTRLMHGGATFQHQGPGSILGSKHPNTKHTRHSPT